LYNIITDQQAIKVLKVLLQLQVLGGLKIWNVLIKYVYIICTHTIAYQKSFDSIQRNLVEKFSDTNLKKVSFWIIL